MTQAQALQILKTGVNAYLTGSAGSGKTYVLNKYIQWLREHDIPVAITASTGIAATHMGGMTIHGWSGIGIREQLTPYDIDALSQKQYLWKRFEKAQVLIIDEVSMLHARTLDMVDQVCQLFKRSEAPFGGMQVILSGDFFQLPPITRGPRQPSYEGVDHDPDAANPDLVVYSRAWRAMLPAICYLSEQHRQSEDEVFLSILNAMRGDGLDEVHIEYLQERMNMELPDGVKFTRLYTHNADVDSINAAELAQIDGKDHVFTMKATGSGPLVEALKKACLAPEVLRLRIGAEVMFLKNNFDAGYVNGTRGIVTGFAADGAPIVRMYDGIEVTVEPDTWQVDEDGKVKASLEQLPLRLAWAITIHKSQGMSLDAAEIDLSKAFAPGMGYVALSRVRTLEGVRLVGLNPNALQVDPAIRELDITLRRESDENESLFDDLDAAEAQKLQEAFITRSGGSIEAIDPLKAKEIIKKTPTILETLALVEDGMSLEDIAKKRDFAVGTIIEHLEKLKADGHAMSLDHVRPQELLIERVRAHAAASEGKLTPIKRALEREGIEVSFDMVKLARLFI
jgi:hypothetical protein